LTCCPASVLALAAISCQIGSAGRRTASALAPCSRRASAWATATDAPFGAQIVPSNNPPTRRTNHVSTGTQSLIGQSFPPRVAARM